MKNNGSPHRSAPEADPRIAEVSGDALLLPRHDPISLWTRVFYVISVAAAGLLLAWTLMRLARSGAILLWWTPWVAVTGILAADFASGIIHWAADTWGSESMPIVGRRLLHPFRVHHVNPDDFLQRHFLDTNGDVAFLGIPFLILALSLSAAGDEWRAPAVFLAAFCGVGLFTNQIHQWAHRPEPPPLVDFLQRCGLILGREAHGRHHAPPYAANYCITTGWCNRALAAVDFFRRAERAVTALTGCVPRQDEVVYQRKLVHVQSDDEKKGQNV